jgi:hypothetical protein
METGVTMITTDGVPMGTRPTPVTLGSLHRRAMVKKIVTYVTSSTTKIHAAGSKDSAEIGSVMSRNSATRGTMITMGPYYDQPHWQCSPEGRHIPGGVKAYSRDIKWVRWPVNFKTSGIEMYGGSTNPTE